MTYPSYWFSYKKFRLATNYFHSKRVVGEAHSRVDMPNITVDAMVKKSKNVTKTSFGRVLQGIRREHMKGRFGEYI
ncbi:hypothetical protein R1flu_013653 [Riccia fluitans]|uniref:Uncharacterized protein n=1 Tax=Riccia fluitans TaxID=41844 RepID=A0ABD1YE13_9MARC